MKKLYPSTVAVTENYKQILLIRTSYFLKYRCLGVIVPGGNYPRWELSRSNCTLQRSIVQGVIICGQLSRGIYPGGELSCHTVHEANCPRENFPSTLQKYVINVQRK